MVAASPMPRGEKACPSCKNKVPTTTRLCPFCSYTWPSNECYSDDAESTSKKHAYGWEGKTPEQLRNEVKNGARFIRYAWCWSAIIVSVRGYSEPYFISTKRQAFIKAFPYTLGTLLTGWWGIPFGLFYSIASIIANFRGGWDVTAGMLALLSEENVGASPIYRLPK